MAEKSAAQVHKAQAANKGHPLVNAGMHALVPLRDADPRPALLQKALTSPWQPLDPAIRAGMESRLGSALGHVRIHSGIPSREAARAPDVVTVEGKSPCITLQPKFYIGNSNDEYEKEADQVSDEVMRMPDSGLQQRKCSRDRNLNCKRGKEEELRKKTIRKKISLGLVRNFVVPPLVHEVLKSPGQPLDVHTREFFEPRFGYDFSGVRVHTDAKAAESARAVNALAYTVGNDVVFGAGSASDNELLAHEMVHVVQQGRTDMGLRQTIQRVEGGQWRQEHERASQAAAASAESARIEGDTEYWGGFAIRPDDETVELILKAVIAEKGFRGAMAFVMDYKFMSGWSKEQAALRKLIIPIMDRKLDELRESGKNKLVKDNFEVKAIKELNRLLDDSEKLVDMEAKKYGLISSTETIIRGRGTTTITTHSLSDNKETKGLETAAGEILTKFNVITGLNKKLESYEKKTTACPGQESGMRLKCIRESVISTTKTDKEAHEQVSAQIERAQQDYIILRNKREADYPILKSFRPPHGLSQLKAVANGRKFGRDTVIGEDIAEKRENIKKIRAVAEDKIFIWKQALILNKIKRELGYKPGSIEARAVDMKVEQIELSEIQKNLTLGLIGLIGALLTAIPSGGSSLAVWGVGTPGTVLLVGSSGVAIYEGFKEYNIQKAATGNTFDKAEAISQDDPSMFWLALMIIMAGFDVAAAAGFFMRAAGAIRAVRGANLDQMAEAAYQSSGIERMIPKDKFIQKYKANMRSQVKPQGERVPEVESLSGKPKEGTTTNAPEGVLRPGERLPVLPPASKSPLASGPTEESIMESYFNAALQSAPEGVEVGIYWRMFPDGSEEYAVFKGYKGGVSAPEGEGWINVSHFHPGAAVQPGYKNPAPQDMSQSLRDAMRRPQGESGPFTQKVHSQAPDGSIIEIEYGVNPQKRQYFIKRPGEPPKYFVDTYPDSITSLVNNANAIADPDKRIQELLKIYRTLDPDKYYSGWYARQFSNVEPTTALAVPDLKPGSISRSGIGVHGGAVQEDQAVSGRGASVAVSRGSALSGEATVSVPGGGQNILIVGAETAEEFAYARQVSAQGGNVTVVNPTVTGEAKAFMRSGGHFVQARIEDLPRQPGFNLIREDFPFPTGPVFTPAASFILARVARLAPGGRWVVMTESAEFAEAVEGVARLQGVTVRGTCVAPYHEAVPASVYPREIGRYVLIIERP